jgi:hypothetical protein
VQRTNNYLALDAVNNASDSQGCVATVPYEDDHGKVVPVSDWRDPGVSTYAYGELFFSDGTQFNVVILVHGDGSITWRETNG